MIKRIILFTVSIIIIAGCGQPPPEPTPQITATLPPTLTPTVMASPTFTLPPPPIPDQEALKNEWRPAFDGPNVLWDACYLMNDTAENLERGEIDMAKAKSQLAIEIEVIEIVNQGQYKWEGASAAVAPYIERVKLDLVELLEVATQWANDEINPAAVIDRLSVTCDSLDSTTLDIAHAATDAGMTRDSLSELVGETEDLIMYLENSVFIGPSTNSPPPTISPSPTNPPGDTQSPHAMLAFSSSQNGNMEIYVMNLDGSGVAVLTDDPGLDHSPDWSPNGAQIAFVSDRDGDDDIYLMNIDGTNLRQLTNNHVHDSAPAWSPDGSQIAFVSDLDGFSAIYIITVDGTQIGRVTEDPGKAFTVASPTWSPDGQKLAYAAITESGSGSAIYTIDSDGQNKTAISDHKTNRLDWSPDGSRFVYQVSADGENKIFVMYADGSSAKQVLEFESADRDPRWSADGTNIVFVSPRGGLAQIYVMNYDEFGFFGLVQLTYEFNFPIYDPSWQ